MIPDTATILTPAAGAPRERPRDPVHREDRPDRDDRVRRGDDDRRRAASMRLDDAPASAAATSTPRNRTSRTSGSWWRRDEVVLELEPAVVGPDLGPDRVVGHRQDRRRDAERSLEPAADVGQAGSPPRSRAVRDDVRREVAVTEPEPRLLAVSLEHRSGGERLALDAPAAAPGSRCRPACT